MWGSGGACVGCKNRLQGQRGEHWFPCLAAQWPFSVQILVLEIFSSYFVDDFCLSFLVTSLKFLLPQIHRGCLFLFNYISIFVFLFLFLSGLFYGVLEFCFLFLISKSHFCSLNVLFLQFHVFVGIVKFIGNFASNNCIISESKLYLKIIG